MFNWFKSFSFTSRHQKFNFTNPTGLGIRNDSYGLGHFGAPRTSKASNRKTHKGTDFLAEDGQDIFSCVSGEVTKIGYPYADNLQYRYIEVSSDDGYRVRHFYVFPAEEINIGDRVQSGQKIGQCQNLSNRYRGMKNHVHIEIKKGQDILNPESLIY